MAELRRYCTCGATVVGHASPQELVNAFHAAWEEFHWGEGHGTATAKEAAAARRREEADRG